MRLLNLPQDVLLLLKERKITAGHARALLGLKDRKVMADVCKTIIDKQLSVRAVEKLVKQLNLPNVPKTQTELSKDAYIKEAERRLTSELGRRVNIKYSAGKVSGSLVLEYFDNDDLEEILSSLCQCDVKNILKEI